MTDPFWMILADCSRWAATTWVWDRAGEIEFVKPGRGTVRAEFRARRAVRRMNCAPPPDGAKVLRWFETEVRDAGGDVVARVRKQLYVRRKGPRDRQRDG